MGKLVAALAVIVLLFVVCDAAARKVAEDRVAGSLQASLELDDKPDVSLSGWPFVFKALSGNFSEVKIDGEGVAASDIRISRIEVVLEGVSFPLGDALSGDRFDVDIEAGSGTVTIGERALQEVIDRQQRGLSVRLSGGTVTLSGRGLPEAEAQVELQGGSLAIVNEFGSISVRLPEIGAGVSYRDVTVSGGKVTVEFDLDESTLRSRAR